MSITFNPAEGFTVPVPEFLLEKIAAVKELQQKVYQESQPILKDVSKSLAPVYEYIKPYGNTMVGCVGVLMFMRGVSDLTRSESSSFKALVTSALGAGFMIYSLGNAFPAEQSQQHYFSHLNI